MALARPNDRHADVGEGRGDWRVRLVHRDPHAGHLLEALEHGVGNGAAIIRTHDVAETVQALRVDAAIRSAR